MLRLAACLLVCSVVGNAAAGEVTREAAMEWMQYGAGKWTTKLNNGTDVLEGTATWRLSLKKNASVGRFVDPDSKGMEIAGWLADEKTLQVTGFDSRGGYWDLSYEKLSAKGGEGPIHGYFLGESFKGHFTAKVIDQENWEWTIEGKSDGQDIAWTCKFVRTKE